MIIVPVTDLLKVTERLQEFRECITKGQMDASDHAILEVCNRASHKLTLIYESHGAIAFFTNEYYNVDIPPDLIEDLKKLAGWL